MSSAPNLPCLGTIWYVNRQQSAPRIVFQKPDNMRATGKARRMGKEVLDGPRNVMVDSRPAQMAPCGKS